MTNIRISGPSGRDRIMNVTGNLVVLVRTMPPIYSDALFDRADEVEHHEVDRLFVEQSFGFDEKVFEQDASPACVWRIVNGCAVLSWCNRDGEPAFARMVRTGEVFGLTETLARIQHKTTLRTVSPCACERMDEENFVGLLYRSPRIRQRLITSLAENYVNALNAAASL